MAFIDFTLFSTISYTKKKKNKEHRKKAYLTFVKKKKRFTYRNSSQKKTIEKLMLLSLALLELGYLM